jgi:hypothetical protein
MPVTTFVDSQTSATIQIAGERPGEKQHIACDFGGVHAKRLSLIAQQRVAPLTALSVEYNDAMFLGEVVTASEHAGGKWHLEVKIEQILTGLQSLMNLRSSLLGEGVPSALRMVPAGAGR